MTLFRIAVFFTLGVAAFTGCSLVDDNTSDCEADHKLTYELKLVTNMTTEIKTELQTTLSTALELQAATALTNHLKGIFTDYAHDVDLSFYDVAGDSLRLHHESHIMDANESSYTLYIPVRRYVHLAMANTADNDAVGVIGDDFCHTATLHQETKDTIASHKTGIYTARLPMDIQEGADQSFDVHLYMVNCAEAVLVDTTGSKVKNIKAVASGFATDFVICDSLWRYDFSPVVRMETVDLGSSTEGLCFCGVNFPSKQPTKAGSGLWRIKLYSEMPDGTVTETVLSLTTPLVPGQLRIIKTKAQPNGSVQPGDPTVGVSVTLNWNEGMNQEIEL